MADTVNGQSSTAIKWPLDHNVGQLERTVFRGNFSKCGGYFAGWMTLSEVTDGFQLV